MAKSIEFVTYAIPKEPFCRLCMVKEGKLRVIKGNCEKDLQIIDLIHRHLQIKFHETGYHVCKDCCRQLVEFTLFYNKVQDNLDRFLADAQQESEIIETEAMKEEMPEEIEEDGATQEFVSWQPSEAVNLPAEEDQGPRRSKRRRKVSERTNDTKIPRTSSQGRVNLKVPPKDDPEEWTDEFPCPTTKDEFSRMGRYDKRVLSRKFYNLQCKICQEDCINTRAFFRHYYNVHKRVVRLVCRLCSKEILRHSQALSHMALHIDPDFFACHTCGHRATNLDYLRIHQKTHEPRQPRKCNQCPREFITKTGLIRHKENVHPKDGQKMAFSCTICGKSFPGKDYLARHKHYYHGKKKECRDCGKSYSSITKLKKHMMKLGHGLLMCSFCSFSTPVEKEMRLHKMQQHPSVDSKNEHSTDDYSSDGDTSMDS